MSGFFHGWLFATLFWTGLSFGSALIVMIHHLTGGQWGFEIRRILEAGMTPMPLMALAFVPICFGLDQLYPWAQVTEVINDEVLQHRKPYLNATGFLLRALIVFAIWIGCTWRLRRLSLRQDETRDAGPTRALRRLSGPALLVLPLAATLAYLDWVISLEKHWYSTIFMLLLCVGQALGALCFALFLRPRLTCLERPVEEKVLLSLGNLLLALVLLWAYLMFAQWLIIWMGNLPVEISWYRQRQRSGWGWLMAAILLFHFAVPFLVLLSREAKQRPAALSGLATSVLVAQVLFLAWVVLPSGPGGNAIAYALLAFVIVGLLWLWRFRRSLQAAPLVVANDPRWKAAHE